jgi:hypothetical protein
MKIALFLLSYIILVHASPIHFNFGGWNGVINAMGKINGVESENHEETMSKAENALKGLIEKHLEGLQDILN